MGFAPGIQLAVPVGLGPVPERPVQPILSEVPLDAEHRALGHIQSLGADQPWSVLSRMRARVVTLAEFIPALTICSS